MRALLVLTLLTWVGVQCGGRAKLDLAIMRAPQGYPLAMLAMTPRSRNHQDALGEVPPGLLACKAGESRGGAVFLPPGEVMGTWS